MKVRSREVVRLLASIVLTSGFLIFSTIFLYLPKHEALGGALSYLQFLNGVKLEAISSDLVLEKTYPISKEEGSKLTGYQFQVNNEEARESSFSIIFTTGSGEKFLPTSNYQYSIFDEDGKQLESGDLTDSGIVLTEKIEANTKRKYTLKFWIKDGANVYDSEYYFQGTLKLKVNSI